MTIVKEIYGNLINANIELNNILSQFQYNGQPDPAKVTIQMIRDQNNSKYILIVEVE